MYFFFFNDTATTEIYTLSLHDALPIWPERRARDDGDAPERQRPPPVKSGRCVEREGVVSSAARGSRPCSPARDTRRAGDRKSTRLNSSHANISYAVFCLKKKKHKLSPL